MLTKNKGYMIKMFFLILICVLSTSCAPQKENTSEKALVSASTEAIKTTETVTSTTNVEPQVATATVEVNAQIKNEREALIAEGKWAFSAYNPNSGVIEYYSANGAFLGKRQI